MAAIQVIDRAFAIIEQIAQKHPDPVKLCSLCEISGLNTPTASRICKSLCENGYLKQVGRKSGYILGHKIFTLPKGPKPESTLLEQIKIDMNDFSEKTGEYICYSILKDNQRYILHSIPCKKTVKVTNYIEIETPYRSVSGRILLSSLTKNEQIGFFEKNGLPSHCWPEVDSLESFISLLDEISSLKILIKSTKDHTSLSVPLYENGNIAAALGVFLPTYRFEDEYRELIVKALLKISSKTK